jgi:hypothetical protein
MVRYVKVARGEERDTSIQDALDLILTPEHRDILTAYFFSRASFNDIASVTEIPHAVLGHFQYLCADMSVSRNKLEHRSWAEKYYEDIAHTKTGQALIRGSILYGPGFLNNHIRLGIETPMVNVKEYAERMLQQAYHMSMMATGDDLTSGATQESLKWYKAATSMLTAYNAMNFSSDAKMEAIVAIESRRNVLRPGDIGLRTDDILS